MRARAARIALVVAVVPAVVAGACSYFEEPDPYRPPAYYPEPDTDRAALGGTLYRRDCGFCHGAEGEGTSRGPDLVSGANGPALTDFMVRTGRMPIDDPEDQIRHRDPEYDEREIDALVAYVDETFDQPGPDIPDVGQARGGDLARGFDLYNEHCAACHATTGIGGAMLAQRDAGEEGDGGGGEGPGAMTGVYIPGLRESTPVEVGEAVRTGPGAMPRFGPGVLDEGELNALVRYVDDLRHPDDRGGAPIGHVGPVAEGAVGWLLGLGLLLLFIRWIGTKRGEQT